MKRLKYAFTWFWAAYKKPEVFQNGIFKTVELMFKFLSDTAEKGSPMRTELKITKLAEILYNDKDKTFLHLWCGVNEIDNPLKRLSDLADDNAKLRKRISELENNKEDNQ